MYRKKVSGLDAVKELFEKVSELMLDAVSLKLTDITTKAFEEVKDKSVQTVFIFTLPDGTSTGSVEAISHYFMQRLISDDYCRKFLADPWGCFMQLSKEIDQITCEFMGGEGFAASIKS